MEGGRDVGADELSNSCNNVPAVSNPSTPLTLPPAACVFTATSAFAFTDDAAFPLSVLLIKFVSEKFENLEPGGALGCSGIVLCRNTLRMDSSDVGVTYSSR